jgi:murein DD-endopeptidase MepM/ murein hydrolase activator NlpD
MGDHRAGVSGTAATTLAEPSSATSSAPSQPYVGRRIAQVARPEAEALRVAEALPYTGRRVAGRNPVVTSSQTPTGTTTPRPAGRRIALDLDLDGDTAGCEDVVGHLLRPTAPPTLDGYVGRRIARPVELITEPIVIKPVRAVPCPDDVVELAPVLETPVVAAPVVEEPVVEEPVVEEPVVAPAADLVAPVLAAHPELTVEVAPPPAVAPKRTRPGGRRVASRRTRVPSLPLLAGVAVLAISAGGALQAVHPDLAGADARGRISPAGALSGSSAVGSASLLGDRGTTVSRSSDRTSGENLQEAADAQAKERDAALSALAGAAEKQAAEIKLHQWVLPVAPGVYHLTARFGDASYLWSHFHTGLDFAAPTGTPIMAVAGGTITEVGYSGAYGNRTIETLPDGTELWYCHQNDFGTSVGATVKPGQVIGYVGSTGNVTGPHLHLEVHPGGGDPVDPYTALQVHGLNP